MSQTLKQYFRYFLVKLGLFDKGAFLLAIDTIYPDDLFVVSYPKSGNTWLRFLIANMTDNSSTITFSTIDNYVPGIHSAKSILHKKKSNRFIKSHYPYFEYYPKTVYILRDLRDVLISYYHYQVALKEFSGTFGEFIRSKKNTETTYGSWNNHVQKAFEHKEKNPEKILIIKYEDLHREPEKQVQLLAQFCHITLSRPVHQIIEKCRFESLKENEAVFGSDFQKQSGKYFFREGKTAAWKEFFSKEDLEWLLTADKNSETLRIAGYPA